MKRINIGWFVLFGSILITLVLWVLAKQSPDEVFNDVFMSLNQIAALVGTVLFVWAMFLSTRLDFLEHWFGGLDRVYHIHRRVSIIGGILLFFHPVILMVQISQKGILYLFPLHKQIAVNFGAYSYWFFVVLILITLTFRLIRLPYHIWKHTHKFMHIAMILALLHIISIRSDTSSFAPLGVWMNFLVGFGVASGLYKTFLYDRIGPRYLYRVEKIHKQSDVYDIFLAPVREKLNHALAQYAYVSFQSKGISKESHPYCITSLPEDSMLRFSVKELGDYTRSLHVLRAGVTANIYGPYGSLARNFADTGKDAICIAGGIGIAPFISMLTYASQKRHDANTTVFYCTKYKKDATFDEELKKVAEKHKNLAYYNQCSREEGGGHLSVEEVKKHIRDTDNTMVYLCGPAPMMNDMKKKLIHIGISSSNIFMEDFEMI